MTESVELLAELDRPHADAAVAPALRVKLATTPWEYAAARQLRRAVFCTEQRLFDGDDGDAIDAHALPIVALRDGASGLEVVGTVRIHTSAPGVWHGSRLAVAADARRLGNIGSYLIKLAVSTANARGCHTFLAQVQRQNVPLFRRLRWQSLSEVDVHGLPHHVMRADLAYYPPNTRGEIDMPTPEASP